MTILLIGSGCAHQATDKNIQHGDYAEAEKTLVQKSLGASSIKSEDLVRRCYVYSKLKKYNHLFKCLEVLEDNIENGDKIISSGLFNVSSVFPGDISIVPHLMKAEAFLETGNYPGAVSAADKAYRLTDRMSVGDKANNWDRKFKIHSLGIIVMANAFNGNRQEALHNLAKLENQSIGFFGGYVVNKEKNYALSKAYMSLGMYSEVLNNFSFGDLTSYLADLFTLGLLRADMVKNSAFGYIELPREFAMNKALFETGKIQEAKEGYDKLLDNRATATNGEIYWSILFDRGRIAEIEHKSDEAISFFKKAIAVIELQRSTINTEASKIGFVGNKQAVYMDLIAALMKNGNHVEAFEYAERSKARALVDMLASKKRFKKADDRNPALDSLLDELKQVEIENSTRAYQNTIDEPVPVASATRGVAIRQNLVAADPKLAALVTVTQPDLQSIQRMIPADVTMVEYFGDAERFFVFLVSSEDIHGVVLDCPHLEKEVQIFRQHLQAPSSTEFQVEAKRLYQMLVRPIAPFIKTDRLTIVPHGSLHYLPFNALADDRGSLLERYTISILPSASVVQFLKPKRTTSGATLVLGNPDLGDPRFDLPFAGQEAEAVSRLLPKARLLLRDKATETAVKTSGGNFGLLHFASHGMFDPNDPLASGLLLAADNLNDGRLTVGELYDLDLNAELVTLSACETALGKVAHGDDVVGFTRGFFYAGARTIISSLWQVDDHATGELMKTFYLGLKPGKTNTALRQAQLKLKNNPSTAHPFFWAAFQMTGLE